MNYMHTNIAQPSDRMRCPVLLRSGLELASRRGIGRASCYSPKRPTAGMEILQLLRRRF